MMIFNVMPANVHFVCPVAPVATSKRITVNGFWSYSEPLSRPTPVDPSAVVSPRAYGNQPEDDPGLFSVTVL